MNDLTLQPSVFAKLAEQRVLFLNEDIDPSSATKLAAQLVYLESQSAKKEITLYINCTGGVVDGGLFTIYDTMQIISCPIKTICIGEAYSSAAVILAAGTPGLRFSYENSKMMIHSVYQDEVSGSEGQIKKEIKSLKALNLTMIEILARHTKNKLSKVKRDCRTDKYMSSKEALKYGLIDEIIPPSKMIPELLKL